MPAKKKIAEKVADLMAAGADAPPPVQTGGTRLVTAEDLAADAAFLDDEAPDAPLGDHAVDMPEAVAAEEPVDAPRPSHGAINAMVKDLLTDPDLSYEAIVDRVLAAHPTARTTARSVASTASVMRRKGENVLRRRSSKLT